MAGLAAIVMTLVSCSVPGIRQTERADLGSPVLNSFALEGRRTQETRDFLRENGGAFFDRNSETTLALARREFSDSPTIENSLVLAELLSDRGGKLAPTDPLAAAGFFLGAAEVSLETALRTNDDQLREIYNYSCGRLTMLLYENQVDLSRDQTIEGPEKSWTLKAYRPGSGMIPVGAADEVWATNSLKLKGFEEQDRITREGFGASMVGHRNGTPERIAESPFLASVGMSMPASVTFDFSSDGRSVEVAIHDGLLRDKAVIGGKVVPLEVDLTAPLATLASHVPDHQVGFKGMLNPEKGSEEAGLFEISL
ncbi:MAG: hypothetical protein AAF357_15420 [Verrucomicrobiota bacterium]